MKKCLLTLVGLSLISLGCSKKEDKPVISQSNDFVNCSDGLNDYDLEGIFRRNPERFKPIGEAKNVSIYSVQELKKMLPQGAQNIKSRIKNKYGGCDQELKINTTVKYVRKGFKDNCFDEYKRYVDFVLDFLQEQREFAGTDLNKYIVVEPGKRVPENSKAIYLTRIQLNEYQVEFFCDINGERKSFNWTQRISTHGASGGEATISINNGVIMNKVHNQTIRLTTQGEKVKRLIVPYSELTSNLIPNAWQNYLKIKYNGEKDLVSFLKRAKIFYEAATESLAVYYLFKSIKSLDSLGIEHNLNTPDEFIRLAYETNRGTGNKNPYSRVRHGLKLLELQGLENTIKLIDTNPAEYERNLESLYENHSTH